MLQRLAVLAWLAVIAAACGCAPAPPDLHVVGSHQHPDLWNPTDVVRFHGKYVASEMYRNQLAIFDDLSFAGLTHFDPHSIGKRFIAPHFLSVTPHDTLLISNGWGKSIVEIADLDGRGWKEFSGVGRHFNAPHGVCADRQGWIYVGDSLNSRLVRFRDMTGRDFEEFADLEKKIGYVRQVVCADDGVWIANSYEHRAGINPGRGDNILRIRDFASGRVEVIVANAASNNTGVAPLPGGVAWAEWSGGARIRLADRTGRIRGGVDPIPDLGVPYGFYHDPRHHLVLVAYFGSFDWQHQHGGILELRY